MTETVSVIIPTMATAARAGALERVLASLRSQVGAKALPIVVANGSSRDREVVEWLSRRRDLHLIEREEGSLAKAVAQGRTTVETEFFSILDDDDEYLPEALAIRVSAMESAERPDVAVTSGFRQIGGSDEPCLPDIESFARDPIAALVQVNWLASCAGLYRTDSIGAEFFATMPNYLEWTYVAFVLALEKRIAFVGRPTYRIHTETPGSLSKSRQMLLETPSVLRRILELELPVSVRPQMERKYRGALHQAADFELRDRRLVSAWKLHWKSLAYGRGLRYLPFTRHFIRAAAVTLLRTAP